MNRDVKAIAEKWLNSNIEESEKAEIRALMKNEEALAEAFYKDLEFGTGGLRGIMGIGSNRMNKYTIGMATQGLANYLLKSFPNEQIKVAIAHDSRNNSRFFAENTAAVFSANGIKVYLFEDLRPTPELSFAIKHLECHSGVVITASHNPKEYNGYKAYWNDGAQLIAPHDKNVINEVSAIKSIDEVNFNSNANLIETIGEEIDSIYLDKVKSQCLSPESVKNQHDISIIYSPIHGTGYKMVPRCLEELGFTNVHLLEEQSTPDGNFPTVVYPNPEEKEALNLAINKAKEINAELIMATDPDSDRVGIAIKDDKGEYILLNGNQTGSLLTYYVLNRWKELNRFKGNECVIKTIVTTDLINDIARHYSVNCYDTLTGFKYIAALIKQLEGKEQFIIGGEESYGYMVGDFVRDKDAIASCAMIAEMCAYASDNGKSLYEMLQEMYVKFGFYKERLISITKKGMAGEEEIKKMMSNFREQTPASFAGSKVVKVADYLAGIERNTVTGEEKTIDFPKSNVLQFFTQEGYKISARPSGTEPKIKFYLSANTKLGNVSDYEKVSKEVDALLDKIEKELNVN
ncbi:phospho-sugar mutase [Fulvivirga lutea]|uniref:Phospho-sugar mutase n=1 Tax=Fulvivirga lutea TaxID=2810512 RepID=A0A974WED7_9BACT|nr:phospho-sugar mutase [Fulvivirga lutea]QSE96778.1 phospho-sugar mutase [Fulvivirga lutea]